MYVFFYLRTKVGMMNTTTTTTQERGKKKEEAIRSRNRRSTRTAGKRKTEAQDAGGVPLRVGLQPVAIAPYKADPLFETVFVFLSFSLYRYCHLN